MRYFVKVHLHQQTPTSSIQVQSCQVNGHPTCRRPRLLYCCLPKCLPAPSQKKYFQKLGSPNPVSSLTYYSGAAIAKLTVLRPLAICIDNTISPKKKRKPGQAGVGFMDITDHRNQTQQAMAPVCVRGSKAHLASKTFCASIPDKVMHQELVDGFNAGLKPKGSYACIYVRRLWGSFRCSRWH